MRCDTITKSIIEFSNKFMFVPHNKKPLCKKKTKFRSIIKIVDCRNSYKIEKISQSELQEQEL